MNTIDVSNHRADDGLVPIIIGVTGHRDLRAQDITILENKVQDIMIKIYNMYPNSPLRLISPLAEGADRLVARVGLKLAAEKTLDLQLSALLPMSRGEYEKDFLTMESKAEFNDLLAKAKSTITMPLVIGNMPDNIRFNGDHRDKQYAYTGLYLVRQCHILIALWDGKHLDKVGGTSHVIHLKREGSFEPYLENDHMILDNFSQGLVYHIMTPRLTNSQTEGEPFAIMEETDVEQKKHLEQTYKHIDELNQNILAVTQSCRTALNCSQEYIVPTEYLTKLPSFTKLTLVKYTIADTLAINAQKKRFRTIVGLLGLALAGVLFFELYAHIGSDKPDFLIVYLLILLFGFSWFKMAKKRKYETKHLDYRAIAEGMRIQFFWQLAGIDECVAAHYLLTKKSELDWICSAIRAWTFNTFANRRSDYDQHEPRYLLNLVQELWVKSQGDYYASKAIANQEKLKYWNGVAHTLFIISLIMTISIAVVDVIQVYVYNGSSLVPLTLNSHGNMHHWAIVLMGLLPAVVAVIGGYTEKMLLSAQAKQYAHMSSIFLQAEKKLRKIQEKEDVKDVQKLLLELGREALGENSDWVLLHRERPLEMSHHH